MRTLHYSISNSNLQVLVSIFFVIAVVLSQCLCLLLSLILPNKLLVLGFLAIVMFYYVARLQLGMTWRFLSTKRDVCTFKGNPNLALSMSKCVSKPLKMIKSGCVSKLTCSILHPNTLVILTQVSSASFILLLYILPNILCKIALLCLHFLPTRLFSILFEVLIKLWYSVYLSYYYFLRV